MPQSLQNPPARSLTENVRFNQAKAQHVPKDVEYEEQRARDREILSLVDRARKRSDLKLEYLASLSGVKISTLSGALNGHGGFNVCWLWSWPAAFWNEFLPLLRTEKEESPDARRAHRKERLIRSIELLLTEEL